MTTYLPFLSWIEENARAMRELVAQWANVPSGTYRREELARMASLLLREFSTLGGTVEEIALPPQRVVDTQGRIEEKPLGKAIRIRRRPDLSLQVLLVCHMDTVFGDLPVPEIALRDDDTLVGPGVADAKGGIAVLLFALRALERSPFAQKVGWEVLLNPDEEAGSPGSVSLLIESAKRHHVGLVFEPSLEDGALVGERKGSGTFTAVIRGRAAHAGRDVGHGRNAIHALADFLLELTVLPGASEGITVNVGYVEGGGPVNVVPDRAACRFNVRVATAEDRQLVERRLEVLAREINSREGFSLELHGSFSRPPKPLDDKTLELLTHLAACGRELGLSLSWRSSGGACDGNILAAEGLATVDSVGPVGGGIHTEREYLFLPSLVERAKLSALLLMKLGSGELAWPPPEREEEPPMSE